MKLKQDRSTYKSNEKHASSKKKSILAFRYYKNIKQETIIKLTDNRS